MVDLPPAAGGGVEAYVWDVARILRSAGHSVTIVSNLREGATAPTGLDIAASRSFIDRFPLPAFASSFAHAIGGSFTALATARLLGSNGHRPVLLHLNEEVSGAWLARRFPSVPKVFTVHNPPPVGVERSYGLFERSVRWANSAVCRKAVWSRMDVVIALSSWIEGYLVANGVPADRVVRLPLPIDTDYYTPHVGAAEGPDPYLLYVGRLDARKNVLALVDALARARTNLRLVLVGRGPAEEALVELARARGLQHRVRFAGRIPAPELLALLRGASALCLPSTLEAYPRVVLEAAACGVPSVLPDSFLYSDFHEAGFATPYRAADPRGLAHALEGLGSDPSLRADLGRKARAFAVRSASYGSFASALERAYRTAFENHAAR
jgi:D-inositol-3-phosphate glycosyltransferase